MVTVFETLSDLKDFIDNSQNLVCNNCIGRQESEKKDNKTTLVTEFAMYTNLGVLYHSSKNEYKTETTMPPIARKETELMDDKENLFESLAKKYKMIDLPVALDKKTGNLIIGYLIKAKEKEIQRVTA